MSDDHPQWITALRAALRRVPSESLEPRLRDADADELRHVLRSLEIPLDPKFTPIAGVAGAMRARFRGASHRALLVAAVFLVEESLESFDDFDVDDATDEELRAAVADAVASEAEPFDVIVLRILALRDDRLGETARRVSDSRQIEDDTGGVEVTPPSSTQPFGHSSEVPQGGPGPGRAPAADRLGFSPLDELLIRTTEASAHGMLGAPSRDEMLSIVSEFAALNSQHLRSAFHCGFLSAYDDRVPRPTSSVTNEHRRLWFEFGRLTGLARRASTDDLAREVRAHPAEVEAVLRNREMGHDLVGPTALSFLEFEPGIARRILGWRDYDCHDMVRLYGRVFERARRAFAHGDHGNALVLFEAIRERLDDLDPIWPDDSLRIEVARRIAMCLRARGDFDAAWKVLDELDLSDASDHAASVATERGLIRCEIADLSKLALPLEAAGVDRMRALLAPGLAFFQEAIHLSEDDGRTCYCLGLFYWCDERYDAAARFFARAEAAFRDDEVLRVEVLEGRAAFNLALSLLLTLVDGEDRPALAALNRSLAVGHRPTRDEWKAAVVAVGAHDSPLLGEFLMLAAEHCRDVGVLVDILGDYAHQGRLEAIDCAVQLAARGGPTPEQKYALLFAALVGAIRTNEARADDVLERLDDLLARAASDELDMKWCARLESDPFLRGYFDGVEADLLRLTLLERTKRFDEAIGVAERLFWRVKNDARLGIDPSDLVDVLIELEAPAQTTTRMRTLIASEASAGGGDPVPLTTVDVTFVGGDERQARARGAVEARLAATYGDKVRVHWIHPGWSANWTEDADAVDVRLHDSEVLVLMRFVRTNLGRRLRRLAGEHERPWVACTGHGQESIARAIRHAVNVVLRRRGELDD